MASYAEAIDLTLDPENDSARTKALVAPKAPSQPNWSGFGVLQLQSMHSPQFYQPPAPAHPPPPPPTPPPPPLHLPYSPLSAHPTAHAPSPYHAQFSANVSNNSFVPNAAFDSPFPTAYNPPFPTGYSPPSSSSATTTNSMPVPISNNYVPVYNAVPPGAHPGAFQIDQAEKRRKPSPLIDPTVDPNWQPPHDKFYGVKVGHVPGVYTDWKSASQQMKGCKGAMHQRFKTREDAQAFVDEPSTVWSAQPKVNEHDSGIRRNPLRGEPIYHDRKALLQQIFTAHTIPTTNYTFVPVTAPTAALDANGALAVPSTYPSVDTASPIVASVAKEVPHAAPTTTLDANSPLAGPSTYQNVNTTSAIVASIEDNVPHVHHESPFGGFDGPSDSKPFIPSSSRSAIAQSSAQDMAVSQDQVAQPARTPSNAPVDNALPAARKSPGRTSASSKALPAADIVLDKILDDDVYRELLAPLRLNDKVALLLNATSRGQELVRKMAASEAQLPRRNAPSRPSAVQSKTPTAAASSDCDSVFSNSATPDADAAVSKKKHKKLATRDAEVAMSRKYPNTLAARDVVTSIEQHPVPRPSWTGALSLEEAHLLIYLKEKKGYRWTEITTRFQEHFPNRTYPILQSNYSQKINRRDRSQDPSTLILPSSYASEQQADGAEIHEIPARHKHIGRPRKQEVNADQERLKQRPRTAVDAFQDQSSGAESSSLTKRPRRAVPIKDYTWPTRFTKPKDRIFDDLDDEMIEPEDVTPAISESPEEHIPAPGKAIAVDNKPLSVEFDTEDANLALASHNRKDATSARQLPYLSFKQRSSLRNAPVGFEWDQLVSRDWQGTLLHVDFTPEELDLVEGIVICFVTSQRALRSRSPKKRIQRLLTGLTEPDLLRVINALRLKLPSRDSKTIDAFLQDAREGKIRSAAPRIDRLVAARPNKSFSSVTKLSLASTIRHREMGIQSHRGWSSATRPVSYQVKNQVQDTLGPLCSYTGASSDVHAVAWSVDGQCFAAGAICVDDPYSMQYNRPNNLLYGDVSRNTINELGRHHVTRPKTEAGPNSTHAMYASQDPKLFKTVTSVAFSPNGKYMFSGGWDKHVAVWQTKYDGSQPQEMVGLRHKAEVYMMSVNTSGVLATATKKSTGNAVKVIRIHDDDPSESPVTLNFSSEKASQRPDMNILPTALHFSPRYENLLLAGFGAQVRDDGRDLMGDICLWDVNGNCALSIWGSGKNVFDLSFHPKNRWFAVGSVAGANTNRGTRSTVRLYDDQNSDGRFSGVVELECPALDINDVVCPGHDHLVAAGCTSGRAYVWDVRNPDQVLRELSHGSSLMPLDDGRDREVTDTGIRFLSWGGNATRLYSGSSDGIVKVWNVTGSEEETFVKDLVTLDSGIMSGAFSPDRSRLLLGEVNGSLNVLEVGQDDWSLKDADRMKYIPYKGYDDDADIDMGNAQPTGLGAVSGIASAQELLETYQIITAPMGGLPVRQVVQGPAYAGPYDNSVDAPFLREQALEMQLKFAEAPVCASSDLYRDTDNDPMITSETAGDSGRSTDRIPDELRLQWENGPIKVNPPPGKVSCSSCGRPALPSDQTNELDGTPLPPRCERCAFSCLRCGYTHGSDMLLPPSEQCLDPQTKSFHCASCDCEWDVGALGYELVREGRAPSDAILRVPRLERYAAELRLARMEDSREGGTQGEFADEMNALTDYYLGLGIEGEESPL